MQLIISIALSAIFLTSSVACNTFGDLQPTGEGKVYERAYNEVYEYILTALVESQAEVKYQNPASGTMYALGPPEQIRCRARLIGVFLKSLDARRTMVEIQEKRLIGYDYFQSCVYNAPFILQRLDAMLAGSPRGDKIGESIRDLTEQLSAGLKTRHIQSLAVLPMTHVAASQATTLGTYLSERLAIEMYKTGVSKVVERALLDKVLEELRLTTSPRFDDESVRRIGHLLGVVSIVIGTYSEVGQQEVEINTRAVNVETGEVIAVGTTSIRRSLVEKILMKR